MTILHQWKINLFQDLSLTYSHHLKALISLSMCFDTVYDDHSLSCKFHTFYYSQLISTMTDLRSSSCSFSWIKHFLSHLDPSFFEEGLIFFFYLIFQHHLHVSKTHLSLFSSISSSLSFVMKFLWQFGTVSSTHQISWDTPTQLQDCSAKAFLYSSMIFIHLPHLPWDYSGQLFLTLSSPTRHVRLTLNVFQGVNI